MVDAWLLDAPNLSHKPKSALGGSSTQRDKGRVWAGVGGCAGRQGGGNGSEDDGEAEEREGEEGRGGGWGDCGGANGEVGKRGAASHEAWRLHACWPSGFEQRQEGEGAKRKSLQ